MSQVVLVLGESGRGKTYSIKNLNPETTLLINAAGKKRPFKPDPYLTIKEDPQKYNMVRTADSNNIIKLLNAMDEDKNFERFQTAVIDDFQYVMSFEFMKRIDEKGYQKWNDIGSHAFKVFEAATQIQRNVIVFILSHIESGTDVQGVKQVKIKTVGQLVDNYITFEGLVENVLYANAKRTKDKSEYFFTTQSDGNNTAKSQEGLFDKYEIPNDLEFVRKRIIEYNS